MSDTPIPDLSAEGCQTRWGRVFGERDAEQVEAFKELAASYWYCVYAWWRRAGLDPADADTGTLACFTHWMREAPPATSDLGAARMREWISAHLAELARDEVELIRPAAIEIDAEWAERRYADEPAGDADAIFQRRWAISVIEFTAATLQTEYAARGEEDLFAELLAFAGFGTGDDSRYQSAATRLGHTVGAMHKAVFDFRTRQREVLRSFAADTLLDPADAESEITALLCAWSAPGMEAAEAPLPSAIQSLRPDEVLARAMQSVRMTHAGEGPWQPPSVAEAAQLFPTVRSRFTGGPRRDGRGVQGTAARSRPLCRDQAPAFGSERGPGFRRAFPARSARHGETQSSEYHRGSRIWGHERRPPFFRHGLRRGRKPAGDDPRRRGCPARGAVDHWPRLRRTRLCPWQGRGASRHQAGEHPRDHRRAGEGGRLRPGALD